MLREFRTKAKGVGDLLHYAMMVDDGILLLKDGGFCAGFSYRGRDLNSSENAEIEFLSASINHIFCRLGDGWMLHCDLYRKSSHDYPSDDRSHFKDPVSFLIDEERRYQYSTEGAHFESEYHLFLTYLPPIDLENKITRLFIDSTQKKLANWKTILDAFKEKISNIENLLSSHLKIKRLNSNALLTCLHRDITGLTHDIKMPAIPVYLDTMLGSQDFTGGIYPKIGNKHLRLISFDGFPQKSEPQMLEVLDQLPIHFRWSNRFIFLDPQAAVSELKKYRRNWFQKRHGVLALVKEVISGSESSHTLINQDAIDMKEDAEEAIRLAESGMVLFGYYTSTIVLYEEDESALESSTKSIIRELSVRGFTPRVETVNAIEAYLGTLPANGYHNVRRPLLHTLNLADLIPLTSVWAGEEINPCQFFKKNSPPLLYAATEGTTPFRLNLHVGDVGHTAIFGSVGQGKSVLLAMICAQFLRYQDAQIFMFDKGFSAYTLCKSVNGSHYELGFEKGAPSFYPLAHIDQPEELNWACEWIENCLLLNHFEVKSEHQNAIRQGLIQLSKSQSRTLTELQASIQDKNIKEALNFYTLAGEMGSILDAKSEQFSDQAFQVFEMEALLQKGESRLIPTIDYIFHKIEKRLSVQKPTLIIFEEGKNFIKGKFGKNIGKYILEKRKQNVSVIFLSQEIEHVVNSDNKMNILNNCFTKIYAPNIQADTALNLPYYRGMGLSDKQIQIIKNAIPKKQYYVTSPLGNRLIDLGLSDVALSFVAITGGEESKDRIIIDELIERYGKAWVGHWLHYRGLHEWANYYEKIAKEFTQGK